MKKEVFRTPTEPKFIRGIARMPWDIAGSSLDGKRVIWAGLYKFNFKSFP